MKSKVVFSFLMSVVINVTAFGQEFASSSGLDKFDFGFSTGAQISGIKAEDFVESNVAPLFNVMIEEKISLDWSLQIGYEGVYFNTIENTDKRHYSYFYGAVEHKFIEVTNGRFNLVNSIYGAVGSGVFVNHYYGRPNICAMAAIIAGHTFSNGMELSLIIKSIVGWDIYQGNEDILNSLSIGYNIPIL